VPNGVWLVGRFTGAKSQTLFMQYLIKIMSTFGKSLGDGNFGVTTFSPWQGYAIPNGLWLVGDFNGDGRDDILHVVQGTDHVNVWLSNGDGTFEVKPFKPWNGYLMPNGLWLVGNFNGDGKADILHDVQDTDHAHIWTSNGDGTFTVTTFSPWPGYKIPNGLWLVGI
jgi:hypothetical protein